MPGPRLGVSRDGRVWTEAQVFRCPAHVSFLLGAASVSDENKGRGRARLFPRTALGEGPGPGLTFPSASELASGSGEGPGLPLWFRLPQGF